MDKPTDWRSGTRRIFSNEFKLHMVELASKPNANVAQLAREHGVDNNLIFLNVFRPLRLWFQWNLSTPRAVLQMLLLRRHYQLLVRLPAMWNSITVK